MSIVDIVIIIFVLLGAVVGFKQGFTKSLVSCVGVILVTVFAFLLKNPVSEFLMSVSPFFNFGGIIKGVTVLNIALYEVIAFALVFGVLMIVLKILLISTGILEKILAFTIVLGIPSKILGAAVGLVKNYIITFFVLYLLSMPNFADVSIVNESNLRGPILEKTPILSNVAESSLKVFNEFSDLKDKYKKSDSNDEFNLETLDLFLKYKVVTVKTVTKLQDSGKINIKGIDKVINKYKEE